ncbi:MAG: pre-peptidase C-terminal domain-containing protein [Pirellulaceae bacterium]
MSRAATLVATAWALLTAGLASAQPAAPLYESCRLNSIFPAGGQRGTTVNVDFFADGNYSGLADAKDILIDGPPGIRVKELKNRKPHELRATLEIAADAPPGRRCIRVLNEGSGLTNMAWFVVGSLPEVLEVEPNSDAAKPQDVTAPVVVNGQVNPAADVDVYRFSAKAGQKLVVCAVAHSIDTHGQAKDYGITDTELTIVDPQGRVVAEAQDTLSLDPLVEFTPAADGQYLVKVQLNSFRGFPQAVYRLTIGEVPVVTSVFPPGGRRGEKVSVELRGPNIPAGTRREVAIPADEKSPVLYLSSDGPTAGNHDVPFFVSDQPEGIEIEPNDEIAGATKLSLPVTMNGQFEKPGDTDCYRVTLRAGETLDVETTAHRFLRGPADTRVEILDAAGKLLSENDDGFALDYMWMHDYLSTDSHVTFKAPQDGEYIVRVREAAGLAGPRAVYRLTARLMTPDFQLWQFPDGVPIWGPGSTAGLIVKIERLAGYEGNVELSLEGLPAGWKGSVNTSFGGPGPRPAYHFRDRVFLTITAPEDAKPGACTTFRVVGKGMRDGQELRHFAQPLTLFYSSDTGYFRATPVSRVAVTKPHGVKLNLVGESIEATIGKKMEIPVQVSGVADGMPISLSVNYASTGVACGHETPQTLTVKDGKVLLPFTVSDQLPPGTYNICVCLAWRSDIRIGMPGPCTPLFPLKVLPAAK